MGENFRREPIRSRDYLDGAKDQTCLFQIPGVCIGGPAVSCHLHDETFGRSRKADDVSVGDGCPACHDLMDGRNGVLSREDWLFYALRALQRTIRRRIEQGLLRLKLDVVKPASERPTPPRKPKSERKAIPAGGRPIPQRQNPWPAKGSRKIATRRTDA